MKLQIFQILFISFVIQLLFIVEKAEGDVRIGTGLSTTTAGRMIPSLYLGLNLNHFALSLASVGVQNDLDYHTGHQLNLFMVSKPGDLLWGAIEGGIGLGVHHYQIGYRENLQDLGLEKKGVAAGPAMRVFWHMSSFLFIGLEAMYGLRGALFLFLSTQDSVFAIVGASF